MPANNSVTTFDLGKLEAKYKRPELVYVPLDHLNIAEELRISAEIFLSVALTFFGYYLSSKQYLWVTLIFIILSIIYFIRYYFKRKDLCNFKEWPNISKQKK